MQLDTKARIKMVSCTVQNPMSFNERLVFSKLMFLRSRGRGATYTKLHRETGLDQKGTLPRVVARLVARGLAEEKDQKVWALSPQPPEQFGWRQPTGEWWQRVAYWKLFLPAPGGITLRDAAVWSLLVSFNQKPLTIRKLARLLHMGRNSISAAVAKLRDVGLLDGMRPVLPQDKLSLFRDRESATYRLSKLWTLPKTPRADKVNAALDALGLAMLSKGWSKGDITTFCKWLGPKLGRADVTDRVLLDLPGVFKDTQKEHDTNVAAGKVKYARNCLGLLKTRAQTKITKIEKMARQGNDLFLGL
jgi:hypothetical protein